ncbi:hypothetical protein CLU79DRAFT_736753 [Phycomyces nitens]|nr:hypothetical protein CLU79DRAFT_736753 [Phycomyces nitens]
MPFSLFSSGSAECGSVNPIAGLMKHFHTDHSFQKDRIVHSDQSIKKNGFRSHGSSQTSLGNEFVDAFLQLEDPAPQAVQTRFRAHPQPIRGSDWTDEFTRNPTFKQKALGANREKVPIQESNWFQEFARYQQITHTQNYNEDLERAFEEAVQEVDRDWKMSFAQQESQNGSKQMTHGYPLDVKVQVQPMTYAKHSACLVDTPKAEVETHSAFDKSMFGSQAKTGFCLFSPESMDLYQPFYQPLQDSFSALVENVQPERGEKRAESWYQLGCSYQDNEYGKAAISAFHKSVQKDPSLIDAWLGLAVSYTNEKCPDKVYDSLEKWIANHPDYQYLTRDDYLDNERHDIITSLFLEAARSFPGKEMDPDVQICLGILFTLAREHDKVIDCFKAALSSKPEDFLLWNKLGATLANSQDIEGALEIYFHALELNPNSVRVRYNIAFSCMRIGQHKEAAEHLLTALALRQRNFGTNPPEISTAQDSLWSTLKMIMFMLNDDELAIQCDTQNLSAFKAKFDF